MLPEIAEPPTAATCRGPKALFTAALLKVASRCNLDCDYCYVYKHADQSWRHQPHFISDENLRRFAARLDEYVALHRLSEFCVTFHGGEPLLYGADRLAEAARIIRQAVRSECALEFSLQTNATLLTNEAIQRLETAGILISLSIDGPKHTNDRHRLDHGGRSTFEATSSAIHKLRGRQSGIFRGVIAVIDPATPPRELFEFFQPLALPRLDLLLPDATYVRPPPRRDRNKDLYLSWLTNAYELWFTEFPDLPIRWFDAILASRLGVPSPTDAMGLGSVSLIVIDTDGTYTDHDVFKILPGGSPALNESVETAEFDKMAAHPAIREHGYRLSLDGLSGECKTCPVVEACGGGSVMHRWHPVRQLEAPSVYCRELFSVFEKATKLLRNSLRKSAQPKIDDWSFLAGDALIHACTRWREETERRADECAREMEIPRNGLPAAALILRSKNPTMPVRSLAGVDDELTWLGRIRVQSPEPWLVWPFSDSIRVLPHRSDAVKKGAELLDATVELLACLDPHLPHAFAALISDVIFVKSSAESSDQIFSFSDDSAPNVLYIAPFVRDRLLDADDLADSLLHEFLHQVLYHIERHASMLLDHVFPSFPAPWRKGLRPSGGFFHGAFVFAGLSRFWQALTKSSHTTDLAKASENAAKFQAQAVYGINSLRQFALLSENGEALLDHLARDLGVENDRLIAPGAYLP
ncbi:MAG: uncharacterized protein QOK24_2767 [Verrucomicrobiota bacterium]|jgi:uncharacterized protein